MNIFDLIKKIITCKNGSNQVLCHLLDVQKNIPFKLSPQNIVQLCAKRSIEIILFTFSIKPIMALVEPLTKGFINDLELPFLLKLFVGLVFALYAKNNIKKIATEAFMSLKSW